MTGTDLARRTPMQDVCERISSDEFAVKIKQALPPSITPDRFVRVTLTAVQQNPGVIVHPASLYSSVIRCAQDGLVPDGREAAFVVFRTRDGERCQYMPMVSGLRKIAAKHDITLTAYVVYEGDKFEYQLGDDPHVNHKPPALDKERGAPIGAYAVAIVRDTGEKYIEVMSKGQIEEVRAVSRAKDRGPWVDWWGEMARKTVARRLFKQLPLPDLDEASARILAAADADADLQHGARMTVEEANVAASLRAGVPEMEPPDIGDDEYVVEADDLVEEPPPAADELREQLFDAEEQPQTTSRRGGRRKAT